MILGRFATTSTYMQDKALLKSDLSILSGLLSAAGKVALAVANLVLWIV